MELLDTPIGTLARENFAALQLFDKNNMDFFCKGTKTLREAITEAGADETNVVKALEGLKEKPVVAYLNDSAKDVENWPLAKLADYIIQTHHSFTNKMVKEINDHIARFLERGSDETATVEQFNEPFTKLGGGLVAHMKKEELMLFPAVKRIEATKKVGNVPMFGTVEAAVAKMLDEHDMQYKMLMLIRQILSNYTPVEGNDDYNMLINEMHDLDRDLPLHIHLENNILFPEAIKMAHKLSASA